jgi:uncharacterized protein
VYAKGVPLISFIKGVGLSYREVFQNDLEELRKDVNFLEIIAESYFDEKRIEEIIKLKNYFPLIPHGLSLSIGSYEDIPLQKRKLSLFYVTDLVNFSCYK